MQMKRSVLWISGITYISPSPIIRVSETCFGNWSIVAEENIRGVWKVMMKCVV